MVNGVLVLDHLSLMYNTAFPFLGTYNRCKARHSGMPLTSGFHCTRQEQR